MVVTISAGEYILRLDRNQLIFYFCEIIILEMLDSFSLKETLTTTMVLFAVIDIVGSIPIIVRLKQKSGHIESESTIVSGILMISFLFVGNKILKFIGVDVNSFAIAGLL